MTDDSRCTLRNTDCTTCKYEYNRHCRQGDYLLPCGSCGHNKKDEDDTFYTCLCLLEPTKEEVETGKCKYYEEFDDADS